MRVVFSYARSEEKLKRLAGEAQRNARAGPLREAAQGADAVSLAVHWSRFDDVLKQAGDLSGHWRPRRWLWADVPPHRRSSRL